MLPAEILKNTGAYSDLEEPVILASGELGIYYINTEKIMPDEGTWKKYGNNDHAMIQHACAMTIRDKQFSRIIDLVTNLVESKLPKIGTMAISGGQRRDWLFSGPVAAKLQVPHISLYKDGKISLVQPNGKKEDIDSIKKLNDFYAVHVVDLLTKGSSVYEGNKSWVPNLRSHGAKIKDLVTIVNRKQGGEERLKKISIKTTSIIDIDHQFFNDYSQNPDRAIAYFSNPKAWGEKYLREHGTLALLENFDPSGNKLSRGKKFLTLYGDILKEAEKMQELSNSVKKRYKYQLSNLLKN